jgi:hypothetical protein
VNSGSRNYAFAAFGESGPLSGSSRRWNRMERAEGGLLKKIGFLAVLALAACANPSAAPSRESSKSPPALTAADRERLQPIIDRIYLERGMDVRVRVEGSAKTTLRLFWRAWDRPWVYREMQNEKFRSMLKAAGFERVLFAPSFVDEGWVWDLEKG